MYNAITTISKESKGTPEWFTENTGGGLSAIGLLERFNYILTDGGKISWEKTGADTVTWTSDLSIRVPNRAFNFTVTAQSFVLLDDEVIFVTLPDVGTAPGGPLVVSKVANGSYLMNGVNTRNYILAYRSGTKLYFGNGWQSVELESGEENELGDGITEGHLIATGLLDENDSTPPYTSSLVITAFTSFTNAISELDAAADTLLGLVTGPVFQETFIVPGGGLTAGAEVTLPSGGDYEVGLNQLEVYYDGVFKESGAGNDFLEIDDGGGIGTKIELVYDLVEDTKITFRKQIGGAGALAPPLTGAIFTGDAVPLTIITIPVPTDKTLKVRADIVGKQTTGVNVNDSVAYGITTRVKNKSGALTLGSIQNDFEDEDATMVAADINYVISGTDLLLQVTGLAAETMSWKASARPIEA
jgi:hypothetical protein